MRSMPRLKGRYQEDRLTDDHQLTSATYPVLRLRDGIIVNEDGPTAFVCILPCACARLTMWQMLPPGVTRWNRVFDQTGVDFRITLPHVAFNRRIGEFAAVHADTEGRALTGQVWEQRKAATMLPSAR